MAPISLSTPPAVTFALVPYDNTAATLERARAVLVPTLAAHPALEYEVLVSDNSPRRDPALEAGLSALIPRLSYEHNGGRNLYYGGGISRIAERAKYGLLVYLCTNHGSMSDPTWLGDLLAPFANPKVALAGSVLPCSHECLGEKRRGAHVQGGIFAARTAVLRRHPYPEPFLHLCSDVWLSREVLRAGHGLADVPAVASRWNQRVADPGRYKIVHEGGAG